MSSNFLSGGTVEGLSDGSANINVFSATIQSLTPNMPVRTNGLKTLVSELLNTSDTIGLDEALTTKDELGFVNQSATPSLPGAGSLKIYSKTNDTMYMLDSLGNETALAGSGAAPMIWRNLWTPQTYNKDDVVLSQNWLMVANKQTDDVAHPQAVGGEFNLYDGPALTPKQQTSKSLVFGQRYQSANGGYIRGYRIYVVVGNSYIVYAVSTPTTNPTITEIANFTATSLGWITINTTQLTTSFDFDLVVVCSEPDPAPVINTAAYNYVVGTNLADPLPGQITHDAKNLGILNIATTDADEDDQTSMLLGLNAGDIIEVADGTRWSIQASIDNTTYVSFAVAPAVQWTTAGYQTFNFETTAAVPISYHDNLDYWLTNPSVSGILSLTGDYGSATINNTQYGADLILEEASVSPDWDFMAYTGGSVSSSGGGASNVDVFSTGLLDGGVISGVVGETTFNIGGGSGRIYEVSGGYTIVQWADLNAIALDLNSDTYIGINLSGNPVQSAVPFTPEQQRMNIVLGSIFAAVPGTITAVANTQIFIQWPTNGLYDMMDAIGIFNVSGNIIQPNGPTLEIIKTLGTVFKGGANYQNQALNPHRVSLPLLTAPQLFYATQTGIYTSGGTDINNGQYDLGGVPTALPGGFSHWTIQRVFVSIESNIVVFLGQALYSSLAEASAAINSEQFISNMTFDSLLLRGYIIAKKGTTALNNDTDNAFFQASRLGSAAVGTPPSSASQTLQETYDNSASGTIITNGALGGLAMQQDGSSAGTDIGLSVEDNFAVPKFTVAYNGVMTSGDHIVEDATPAMRLKDTSAATIATAVGRFSITDMNGLEASIIDYDSGLMSINNKSLNGAISIVSGAASMTVDESKNETSFTTGVQISGDTYIDADIYQGSDRGQIAFTDLGGGNNVVIGDGAYIAATSGARNVIIGEDAGTNITTGSSSVMIGEKTNQVATNTNCIAVGYDAQATASDQATIGNQWITVMRSGGDGVCSLGSTTNRYNDLHLAGNITIGTAPDKYTMPIVKGAAGAVLTDVLGDGVVSWANLNRSTKGDIFISNVTGFMSNGGLDNNKVGSFRYLDTALAATYTIEVAFSVLSWSTGVGNTAQCQILLGNNTWLPTPVYTTDSSYGSLCGNIMNNPGGGYDHEPLAYITGSVVYNAGNTGWSIRMYSTRGDGNLKVLTRGTFVYTTATPP